jgi:hypothetical protein
MGSVPEDVYCLAAHERLITGRAQKCTCQIAPNPPAGQHCYQSL